MFSKAFMRFKFIIVLAVSSVFISCGSSVTTSQNGSLQGQQFISRSLVPNQLPAPQTIKSIQLHRKSGSQTPPIIQLNSYEKLKLSFDELSDLSGQFRITFTHYNQNWEESNIPPDWYLDGMNEIIVGGGIKNKLSEPTYFRYSTEFPNNQVQFKVSGNYMLHVSDFSSGVRLFSLPFFVTENAGEIASKVETTYNAGGRYNAIDRPFTEYIYPDFIEFPEFDLSFYFVQNRFWGDAKQSQNYDFSEEDRTQFHLSTERAFAANYDFLSLNLQTLGLENYKILDWQPQRKPPLAILREDVLNLSASPTVGQFTTFGSPLSKNDARYVNVRFRFEDGGRFAKDDGVYLVGDFNQWLLSERNKLAYNPDSGYWEAEALVKQGTYTYKYAMKAGSTGIDDLTLSDTITRQQQEYISFVYFQDPVYRHQRLLQVQVFTSGR